MYKIQGKHTSALITINEIEEACANQINIMSSHPAFTNPIVIMPDTHQGKGSVIGFTMLLTTKVIPQNIGVDIGCGVSAIKLKHVDTTKLKEIDIEIKRSIPTGTNINKECQLSPTEWDSLFNVSKLMCEQFLLIYNKKFNTNYATPTYNMDWFYKKVKQIGIDPERANNSLSSLGSGNHYIAVEQSLTHEHFWLMIHTGSRKLGECICRYHQNIAKESLDNKRNTILRDKIAEIMREYKSDQSKIQPAIDQAKKDLGLDFEVDMKGMEYLEGQQAMDYFFDMIFAQQYAKMNRKKIAEIIIKNALNNEPVLETIDTVHNYIDFQDLIIRKGAIQSYSGVKYVIPLNMEDGSLIVEGKSNPEWNYSAPHGAGRLMSRTKAKEVLSLEEMKEGMANVGVYSTSLNKHTIDEAKGAYKSSAMIEAAIEPTATILERVKPILNIKDASNDMSWKEKRNEKRKREDRKNKELNDLANIKMKKIK